MAIPTIPPPTTTTSYLSGEEFPEGLLEIHGSQSIIINSNTYDNCITLMRGGIFAEVTKVHAGADGKCNLRGFSVDLNSDSLKKYLWYSF